MYKYVVTICLWFSVLGVINGQQESTSFPGFFPFEWIEEKGELHLIVDKLDYEFLYVNSLAAGVGSNDIGLDRGQLGNTRLVKFIRSGNKILLIQPNLKYRAKSDNPAEIKAVEEAFAQSVLWGFSIKEKRDNGYLIDLTPFLLQDAHGVTTRLKETKQGSYKLDKNRSAIWLDRTKNFPKNSEFESLLTFVGKDEGDYIRSVSPDAKVVSVRQHHSFIELPDEGYTPRKFHAGSGFIYVSHHDYAAPIHESTEQRYIIRHRLEKKDPTARMSEAVQPIIYYLDPGCPEPVRSALIDGAMWWNEAFEVAGYRNAFQVKMLPEGADPLDVRYNVIQWVHRSTRGWSYGGSVVDPRTGEIIKGHVSLGSLRVRQDFMIAQGILSPYSKDENHQKMEALALARLRQLSAHEIGHTIGMAHNFAASYNDRASVMDYPHPFIQLKKGNIDLSISYDDKIGAWDKRTVLYGYQDFSSGTDEQNALLDIIRKNESQGFLFISDEDARPASGAHPFAHLWDNGKDPVIELNRLVELRKSAMKSFGMGSITNGTPLSKLENVFAPVYLMHRYQIEAVSKLIGGYNYNYAVKDNGSNPVHEMVSADNQQAALQALLTTLNPEELMIPDHIKKLMLPPAYGYPRDRESFRGNTGIHFDPLTAAESLAGHVINFLLTPERLNRIYLDPVCSPGGVGIDQYFNYIRDHIWGADINSPEEVIVKESVKKLYFFKLLSLLDNARAFEQVKASVLMQIEQILSPNEIDMPPFERYLSLVWTKWMNGNKEIINPGMPSMPPGSPIGCGSHF